MKNTETNDTVNVYELDVVDIYRTGEGEIILQTDRKKYFSLDAIKLHKMLPKLYKATQSEVNDVLYGDKEAWREIGKELVKKYKRPVGRPKLNED